MANGKAPKLTNVFQYTKVNARKASRSMAPSLGRTSGTVTVKKVNSHYNCY